MRTALLILAILAAATTSVQASPFLVSDQSSDNATSCVFESFPVACVLDANKAIRVDLATLPVGSHSVRAAFCRGVWCGGWSTVFPFVKPSLGVPVNVKLSQ
jgi:hypothetical protein